MTDQMVTTAAPVLDDKKVFYNRFLLVVAGLGGLLYGVDVGIIAGALPYLQDTSKFSRTELGLVVAAVLLGSVISTLFAGLLADWMGRKALMVLSGVMFVISIPMIALAHSYSPLIYGRLLQGTSAGLIGVVVPLYLAECLRAANRGKGTGIFQWLLTAGIAIAALIALLFSFRLDQIAKLGDPNAVFNFKNAAWRGIFWMSLPPGILFVVGSLMLSESPRWLLKRGKREAAYLALLRSRTNDQADLELREMQALGTSEKDSSRATKKDSLLSRKYVIPFILACIILACNQTTGINSIIAYNTNILLQSGLSDLAAHVGYVIFTFVNFFVTLVGVALVDRKGRKFLLGIGTAGIIVSMLGTGVLFRQTEKLGVDSHAAAQLMVAPDQTLKLTYNQALARTLLSTSGATTIDAAAPTSLVVIYSYGDFRTASQAVRSDDPAAKPIEIKREDCVPANKIVAFFSNPFGNLDAARTAPLRIENALITPVPSERNGWIVAVTLFVFMAFFAMGPGVCVWLALSELMPTRIRSNGMSIALVLNQAVSTTIAAIFLPTVGKYGYSTMFFGFAACTVIYFVTATWFLPETKGKTLEEIEAYFEHGEARG
jgi:MFS family permease